MIRIEENKMVLNEIFKETERQPTGNFNDTVAFQLRVIASTLMDISRSLAIIADQGSEDA